MYPHMSIFFYIKSLLAVEFEDPEIGIWGKGLKAKMC